MKKGIIGGSEFIELLRYKKISLAVILGIMLVVGASAQVRFSNDLHKKSTLLVALDSFNQECLNRSDSLLRLDSFSLVEFELLNNSLFNINYYKSDEAQKLYKRAIQKFQDCDQPVYAGILMKWLSDLYYELGDINTSRFYIYQASESFQRINNELEFARTANVRRLLSTVQTKFGDAYSICFEALDIFEKYKDETGKAITYRDIGSIKLQEQKFQEALGYCLDSKTVLELNEDWYELTFTYQRIALIYIKLNQFERAHEFIDKSIYACKQLTGFRVYQGLFKKYWTKGKIYEAEEDFDKALACCDTSKYFSELVDFDLIDKWLLNSKGNILLKQQKFSLALDQFNQAIAFVEKESITQNTYDYFNPIYENMITAYEGLGRFKDANYYLKQLTNSKDSIFQLESEKQTAELQTKYHTFQNEQQIEQLEKEKASQRIILWLSAIFASALLALAFFLWRSNRYRSKLNAILTGQKNEINQKNEQNELLLKEIHHRVKNNLEIVSGLLELQSAQISDEAIQKVMQESQNRVQAMGILHQRLYQGVNLGSVEMKDYFLNLSEGVLDSFKADQRISVELAMQKLALDVDTAVPLGLIVNELLTNTLKYAFPNDVAGQIKISMNQINDYMILQVADNGIGTDFDQPAKGTGFGGQLVQLLTRQLGGELTRQNNQGTVVTLKFKKPKAA